MAREKFGAFGAGLVSSGWWFGKITFLQKRVLNACTSAFQYPNFYVVLKKNGRFSLSNSVVGELKGVRRRFSTPSSIKMSYFI